jgi:hypothetical protein
MVFMNGITFSPEGKIRPAAVVLVGLVLSAVAFALDMVVATAAPSAFGAPGEVAALGFATVLGMSVPAVLGNTVGFYYSYRRYDPRALVKFLAPGAGFYVAFMVPHVWGLLAGGTFANFGVAAALTTLPVTIGVTTLLALRPGPVNPPHAAAPDNARGMGRRRLLGKSPITLPKATLSTKYEPAKWGRRKEKDG